MYSYQTTTRAFMSAVAKSFPAGQSRVPVSNIRYITQSEHAAARRRELPRSALQFRLEQTQETLQVAGRLLREGRLDLVGQFIDGVLNLINRDLGGAR
jgi:hypothetical protein